jgi:hypothetical protein
MSIETTNNTATFLGTGSTGPFPFNFPFFSDADLKVTKTDAAGAQYDITDVVITGAGSGNGGQVTLSTPLAVGESLAVTRIVEITQPTVFPDGGAFFASTHEKALDRQVMILQQLDAVNRQTAADLSAEATARANAIAALSAGLPSTALSDFSTTIQVRDIITKEGLASDVRAFFDGLAGRPTLAAWQTDNTIDVTAAVQAAIDYAVSRRMYRVLFCSGRFNVNGGLVINYRDLAYSTIGTVLELAGAGGGSVPTYASYNTTLYRTSPGDIIRICQEADGSYPGGGAGVVTQPLNFLRRINLHDLNLEGDLANPNNVNGVVGRGIYRSEFRNLGFYCLQDGIRLGKRLASSQELSSDGINLDYCERNKFENVNMRQVDLMIHVLAPDILTIRNCYLSECNTTGGRILYIAGGNDYVDLENNIIHPFVHTVGTPIGKAIEIAGSTRGIRGRGNHIEGLSGTFLYGGSFESIDWQNNLFTGTVQSTANIFNILLAQCASVVFKNNNVGMPSPTTNWFSAVVIGDDGSYTKLKTCSFDIDRNKVTTALGGTSPYLLSANWTGVGIGTGRWATPAALVPGSSATPGYTWMDTTMNVLRYKLTKPTSETDGILLGDLAYVNSTFAFPGVTVAAGAWGTVVATIPSANLGRFVRIAPAVSLAGLSYSVHATALGSCNIVFYNPTGASITIAPGTWNHKIELS